LQLAAAAVVQLVHTGKEQNCLPAYLPASRNALILILKHVVCGQVVGWLALCHVLLQRSIQLIEALRCKHL
jgi:hypothetical protein